MELLSFSHTHVLVLSFTLFMAGFYVFITKKNMIHMLIGLELMLNAALINFICFGKILGKTFDASMFAILAIVVAVGAAAVSLAILLNYYYNKGNINPDEAAEFNQKD